jgi:hypothetical protein
MKMLSRTEYNQPRGGVCVQTHYEVDLDQPRAHLLAARQGKRKHSSHASLENEMLYLGSAALHNFQAEQEPRLQLQAPLDPKLCNQKLKRKSSTAQT